MTELHSSSKYASPPSHSTLMNYNIASRDFHGHHSMYLFYSEGKVKAREMRWFILSPVGGRQHLGTGSEPGLA